MVGERGSWTPGSTPRVVVTILATGVVHILASPTLAPCFTDSWVCDTVMATPTMALSGTHSSSGIVFVVSSAPVGGPNGPTSLAGSMTPIHTGPVCVDSTGGHCHNCVSSMSSVTARVSMRITGTKLAGITPVPSGSRGGYGPGY